MFIIIMFLAEFLSFGILYSFSKIRGTNYLPNISSEVFKVENYIDKTNDEITTNKNVNFKKIFTVSL